MDNDERELEEITTTEAVAIPASRLDETKVRFWIDKWTKLIPQKVRDDFEQNVRSWRG